MSTYTTYLDTLESDLTDYINTFVTKQQIDAKGLCAYKTKARILAIFTDMIPLLYNCDTISDDEFEQMQNLILKITGDTDLGIIDSDDLACAGISSQITRTVSGIGTTTNIQIQRGKVNILANIPINIMFTETMGTGGSDYSLQSTCYNTYGIVGYTISARTQYGFVVTAIEDSIFEYIAILL